MTVALRDLFRLAAEARAKNESRQESLARKEIDMQGAEALCQAAVLAAEGEMQTAPAHAAIAAVMLDMFLLGWEVRDQYGKEKE